MNEIGGHYAVKLDRERQTVCYHLCVESKIYSKLGTITKKEATQRYREQISGYQSREGSEERRKRNKPLCIK